MTSVCRVCLVGNKRLIYMKNKLLQNVYEKLSDTKFNSKEARPRVVCGSCYQKLQSCHAFSQMAHKSENIISQLFLRGLEVTREDLTELNRGMGTHLSVATAQVFMDNSSTDESSHVTIKVEIIPEKEEVTSEEDPLVDIESVYPENYTNELIFDVESDDNGHIADLEQTSPDDTNASTSYSESKDKKSIPTRTQAGNQIIACHICDKKFNQRASLFVHMRTHTGENSQAGKKNFACHICKKKFNQRANLYAHMRTHTGEKPYACSLCEKRYSGKTNLDAHIRIHTGEKPFACDACDKRFKEKAVLLKHITKIHMSAKPFACHVCKEKFYKKYILVDHIMANHPGEKAFACNVCKRQFNRKLLFDDHMRIHTDEKPFYCNVCNKYFRSGGYLRSHTKTHAREKLFA